MLKSVVQLWPSLSQVLFCLLSSSIHRLASPHEVTLASFLAKILEERKSWRVWLRAAVSLLGCHYGGHCFVFPFFSLLEENTQHSGSECNYCMFTEDVLIWKIKPRTLKILMSLKTKCTWKCTIILCYKWATDVLYVQDKVLTLCEFPQVRTLVTRITFETIVFCMLNTVLGSVFSLSKC